MTLEKAAFDRALLTGATGFLGIHMLCTLLDTTGAQLTCLVRGDDDRAAQARLLRLLEWYFPERTWRDLAARVRVLAADLTLDRLGVSDAVYEALASQPAHIFNVAAEVRHVGSRAHFFRMNVQSVAALIELAEQGAAKHLHHVSSLAVRGRFLRTPQIAAFSEQHLDAGQAFVDHPYAESKFHAELLLRDAFAQGCAGTVYRVGNIGPHSRTGRFQRNIQASDFAAYLRAATRVGLAPYRPALRVRLTPVDAMAGAIVALARTRAAGRTYYVDSPHDIGHYDVMRLMQALGYSIRLLEACDFAERAVQLIDDDEALAMMLPAASLEQGVELPIDAAFSEDALARLGFEYPRVSGEWLGSFFDHAIALDFLAPPRHWRPGSLVRGIL